MLIKDFITLLVFPFLLVVIARVQSQQILDGAIIKRTSIESNGYKILGNQFSGRLDFPKPTTPPFFSCFDLDACRTGLEFCNQRRKTCEKCEDYRRTCGTNLQNINCTQYCVALLVEEQCLEKVATKHITTLITTGGLSENRQQTYTPVTFNKSGHDIDWKLIIIGILGFAVIILLALNIYLKRQIKGSKSKEQTDEQIALMDVCSAGPPSGDRVFTDVISSQYSSVPSKNDNCGHDSMQPSACIAPPKISDREQTKVKEEEPDIKYLPSRAHETNIGEQKRCSRRITEDGVEMKTIRAEIQGQEVDYDKWSTSGYSSSSTQSLAGIPVINNTINITLNGMTNLASIVPTVTDREDSDPEDTGKEAPYSVQETYDNDKSSSSKIFVVNDHAQTNNQKPVSDENNCTKIAVGDMSVDMDDLQNCFKQVSDENNCTKIALGDMSDDMDDFKNCFKQDT